MRIMNQQEFDSFCATHHLAYHHSSTVRGYVSRKMPCDNFCVEFYTGRFGEGLKVYYPNYTSTRYCKVSYFTR